MTSGKQRRNRFYTPTPGERALDVHTRLANVNTAIDEMCVIRDKCLIQADDATRIIQGLKNEQLKLVTALNMQEQR